MANVRRWALMLLVVLAATHCTESRSTPPDDVSADYNAFSDEEPTGSSTNDDMMRDEQDDVQGDEDGDDDDADDADGADKVILSAPRNLLVAAGKTVHLPCQVSESDEISSEVIAWNHGETLLSMGSHSYTSMPVNNPRITVHPNWTLEIKSVSILDAGTYTCKLMTAEQGPKQSVVHTLRIAADNSPPKIIQLDASSRRVVEGDSLTIRCVTEGHPKPKLIWSRKSPNTDQNTRIMPSEGTSFEEDSIKIDSVRRNETGKYFCMAENSVGNPAIQSIDISVVGKPVIREHRPEVNAAIGITAILGCTVHHEPRSTVTWYKDGRELENSGDVSIEHRYPTTQLTIQAVKEKDFGVYSCHARNQFGEHHRSISLVQTPVLDPIQVTADALVWTVTSHSGIEEVTLKYRRPVDKEQPAWQKQILRPVKTVEPHRYEVRFPLADLPPGQYEARAAARNQYGWGKESPSVFFEGANEEPENIQAAGVGLHLSGAATELQSTPLTLATLLACLLTRLI